MCALKLQSLPALHRSSDAARVLRAAVERNEETDDKVLRFLIIENLPIFGLGLAGVISSSFNAHVQLVLDVRKGLDICATEELDLILLGASKPERRELSLLAEFDRFCAKCPILIVSLVAEGDFVPRALKESAAGYIMKSTSPDELVRAVECLLKGGRYVSGPSLARSAGSISPAEERLHASLSVRELDVFMRIAGGSTAKEIAGDLSLSVKTVSTHHTHIFSKLNIRTDAQLGGYAVRNRLVS
jgi:two-component system, NarL family, invasion response regulator UvrY